MRVVRRPGGRLHRFRWPSRRASGGPLILTDVVVELSGNPPRSRRPWASGTIGSRRRGLLGFLLRAVLHRVRLDAAKRYVGHNVAGAFAPAGRGRRPCHLVMTVSTSLPRCGMRHVVAAAALGEGSFRRWSVRHACPWPRRCFRRSILRAPSAGSPFRASLWFPVESRRRRTWQKVTPPVFL